MPVVDPNKIVATSIRTDGRTNIHLLPNDGPTSWEAAIAEIFLLPGVTTVVVGVEVYQNPNVIPLDLNPFAPVPIAVTLD